MHVVVMGVAGCGKSTVGQRLAAALGLPFLEGDDFHDPAHRARMAAGQPLTDADRAGWLGRLAEALAARPAGAVLSCSALKRAYRDRLRAARPGLWFAYLQLSPEAAMRRVAQRAGHFFPPALLADQFATLEPPLQEAGVIVLEAELAPDQAVARLQSAWPGLWPVAEAPRP